MNSPKAAKTTAHNQASTRLSNQTSPDISAPLNDPTRPTTSTDASAIAIATVTLTAMYAIGRNGVRRHRSWWRASRRTPPC